MRRRARRVGYHLAFGAPVENRAANVAVSDEPKGGSPTGAPTGAVLYVAELART